MTEGRTESPLLPLDETVTILETADEIRRQVGVVYPGGVRRVRSADKATYHLVGIGRRRAILSP